MTIYFHFWFSCMQKAQSKADTCIEQVFVDDLCFSFRMFYLLLQLFAIGVNAYGRVVVQLLNHMHTEILSFPAS